MLNTASTNILILLDTWIHSWTPLLTGLTRISLDLERLDENQQLWQVTVHPNPTNHRRHCIPLHSIRMQILLLLPTDRSINQPNQTSTRPPYISRDTSRTLGLVFPRLTKLRYIHNATKTSSNQVHCLI
jgi:hypothetical protein